MRKKRQVKVPIHVNIPLKVLDAVDEVAVNRSGYITKALQMRLHGDGGSIEDTSTRQLMAALAARPDVDPTLRLLLRAMLLESDPFNATS